MACLLGASAIAVAPYFNPRPALFSLLLFVLVIAAALEKRLWWTLPALQLGLGSVHGGWPLGVLFVLLWAIYQRNWRLGQQIVPMGLIALFTAHGWGVLEILIDFVRAREWLSLITEWAPTNLSSLPGFIFLVGLLIAVVGPSGDTADNVALIVVPRAVPLPCGFLSQISAVWLVGPNPAACSGCRRSDRAVDPAHWSRRGGAS